jgi:RimJ/RimL family protein N-acetyltransferase
MMSQMVEISQSSRIFPALTTTRLFLREFSLDDVQTVFEMLSRVDVNEWLETDPMQSIEALASPGNTSSIRLLEKLGFVREGLRREFGFWKGRYQDVYMYALLNFNG